jgi:hypothetical protein
LGRGASAFDPDEYDESVDHDEQVRALEELEEEQDAETKAAAEPPHPPGRSRRT